MKLIDAEIEKLKSLFEANLLDGDKINDCGRAMLSAEFVWEFLEEEYHAALKRVAAEAVAVTEKQRLEILKRLKLEFDVCICECGEKWNETDAAKIVEDSLEQAQGQQRLKDNF